MYLALPPKTLSEKRSRMGGAGGGEEEREGRVLKESGVCGGRIQD